MLATLSTTRVMVTSPIFHCRLSATDSRVSPRSVDGATLREHGDELLDAASPRLRTLGVVDAEQDRVAVARCQALRTRAGPWRCVAAPGSGRRGPRWCGCPRTPRPSARRPSPRRPRACPAGRMRPAAISASARSRLICDHLLRGCAGVKRWRKYDVVVLVAQAVDPAVAERDLDGVGDSRRCRRRCPSWRSSARRPGDDVVVLAPASAPTPSPTRTPPPGDPAPVRPRRGRYASRSRGRCQHGHRVPTADARSRAPLPLPRSPAAPRR